MQQEQYDELLSAYLDRELSPEERAVVDRLLKSSPDARERLQELEQASRFLRNLPREELEEDFAEGVLERLDRESALRPSPKVPRRSTKSLIWLGGLPATAAAAVLALAVLLRQDPMPVPRADGQAVPRDTRVAPMVSSVATEVESAGLVPGNVVLIPQERGLASVALVVDRVQGLHQIELLCLKNQIEFESEAEPRSDDAGGGSLTVVEVEAEKAQVNQLILDVFAEQLAVAEDLARLRVSEKSAPDAGQEWIETDLAEQADRLQEGTRPRTDSLPLNSARTEAVPMAPKEAREGADLYRLQKKLAERANKTETKDQSRPRGSEPRQRTEALRGAKTAATDELAEEDEQSQQKASLKYRLHSSATAQPESQAALRGQGTRGRAKVLEVTEPPETLEAINQLIVQWRRKEQQRRHGRMGGSPIEKQQRQKVLLFIIQPQAGGRN